MKFWDTSALLRLLLEEQVTAELTALLATDGAITLWWGTKVEAVSALCRFHRSGHTTESMLSPLLAKVEALAATAQEVQPSEEVHAVACRVVRIHDLRAADAFQLAAALVWSELRPAGMGFVCLDRRLCLAAAREGFTVLPEAAG